MAKAPQFRRRDRPLRQLFRMNALFPQFEYRPNRKGGMEWRGGLRPTPESANYQVRIVHNPGRAPRVFVDSHDLDRRCRHLYADGSLCLYWPEEWRWTSCEFLTETLVPWTAFWLYFYEMWVLCGEWLGPSSPHGIKESEAS